jgi:hypothetical protein
MVHWGAIALIVIGVVLFLYVARESIHLVGRAKFVAAAQTVYGFGAVALAALLILGVPIIVGAIEGARLAFPHAPLVAQSLCKAQTVCRRYAKARQECAIAGDFALCVRVKMGEDLVLDCQDDGVLKSEARPTAAECLLWDTLSPLGWLAEKRQG